MRRLLTPLFTGLCDAAHLNAAYTMTSAITLSQLVRGDHDDFDRDVVLRLALLAATTRSQHILSSLLQRAVGVAPTQRGVDGEALVLYVVAACAHLAAAKRSIEIFEGRLDDAVDQDVALELLDAFASPKLRIELLVQSQRHSEALEAAQRFVAATPQEQMWAGVVAAHLRSVSSVAGADEARFFAGDEAAAVAAAQRLGSDAAVAGARPPMFQSALGEAVRLDADVVRPVNVAFYARPNSAASGAGATVCRVPLAKSGAICGCAVPCPYHSATTATNAAVARA